MDLRMLHGKTALALSIALALPGAAQAIGLGEIHLDSALNEPLAANIEIVGATENDLKGITATIANRETFERFGVERPEFLSTVAFKISRDSSGRPVLAMRSTDACTELVVNMLVDLRWGGGDLIRQYTLLIDPPGFPSPTRVAEAVVGAPASYTAPIIEAPKPAAEAVPTSEKAATAAGEPVARKTVRVGAKATLRGVAWRVGSRSDADLNRMMMAIFRANPNAFEGNINRLRLGAVLTIPSAAEVSAISVADANHEVRAQMQGWHPSARRASPPKSVAAADAVPSGVPSPPAAGSAESAAIAPAGAPSARRTAAEAAAPAGTELDHRVQQLETELGELRQQLDSEHDALHDALVRAQAQAVTPAENAPAAVRAQAQAVTPAENAPAAVHAQAQAQAVIPAETAPAAVHAQPRSTPAENAPAAVAPSQADAGRWIGSIIAAVLALAAAVFGIYAWRRRRAIESTPAPAEPKKQDLAPVPVQVAPQAAAFESAARSMPIHVEPGAVPVADGLFGPDSIATEIKEAPKTDDAANREETVDLEKLEASYLWEGNGSGFDNTDNFGETASLAIPEKLRPDDPSGEMMALETAILAGIPEPATWGLGAADNAAPPTKAGAEATELDYNLSDLDVTVQHVTMPSAFHENAGFKEHRISLVEALKSAVDREPHRLDLRMKLLETYYAAAATSRKGFLDTVQKIAAERANLNEGEWDKIASMGRQIASDDDLFAPVAAQPDEEDLANCA